MASGSWRLRFAVLSVLWFFLLLPAGSAAGAEDATSAPDYDGGDPIDAGFLFSNGRYVRAPYTVERRGLDIFINGILVSRGPEALIPTPNEDPGEPPPGADPFDRFFGEKWRYLSSRYGHAEATQLMLQAYRKCDGYSAKLASSPAAIEVTEKGTGEETCITLSDSWKMRPSQEQMRAGRAARKQYFEQLLRRNRVVSVFDGGEHIMAGSDGQTALGILLSNRTPQDKVLALERRGILKPGDTAAQCIVKEYHEDAQLAERYGRLLRREPLAGNTEAAAQDSRPAQAAADSRPQALEPGGQGGLGGPPARAQEAAPQWRVWAFAAILAAVPCLVVLIVLRKRVPWRELFTTVTMRLRLTQRG